jgi:hypothetical protein
MGEPTTTSITESTFCLRAIVRTNDPKLTIVPKATINLTNTWSNSIVTSIGALQGVSQTNTPTGCERKEFYLDRTNSPKGFIKLEILYSQ